VPCVSGRQTESEHSDETKDETMNTDKRVLMAILLSIAVWLLYESFLAPPRQAPPPPVTSPEKAAPAPAPLPRHVPDAAAAPESRPLQAETGHSITVHNSLYRLTLAEAQAGISSVRLFNYNETLPPPAMIAWIRRTFSLRGDTDTSRSDNFKEMIGVEASDPLPVKASFVYPNGTLASVAGGPKRRRTNSTHSPGQPALRSTASIRTGCSSANALPSILTIIRSRSTWS
jgi:hypothetical protein